MSNTPQPEYSTFNGYGRDVFGLEPDYTGSGRGAGDGDSTMSTGGRKGRKRRRSKSKVKNMGNALLPKRKGKKRGRKPGKRGYGFTEDILASQTGFGYVEDDEFTTGGRSNAFESDLNCELQGGGPGRPKGSKNVKGTKGKAKCVAKVVRGQVKMIPGIIKTRPNPAKPTKFSSILEKNKFYANAIEKCFLKTLPDDMPLRERMEWQRRMKTCARGHPLPAPDPVSIQAFTNKIVKELVP